MIAMPERRFKAAATVWGPGKVHECVWDPVFGRWIAGCQNLNPDKGGMDAWPGKMLPQTREYELTCKRCLGNLRKKGNAYATSGSSQR